MAQSSPPECAGSKHLTPDQRWLTGRARRLLAEQHGHEPADLAARIGRLEWAVGELLALADELAAR